MLRVNKTLRILCIRDSQIGLAGFSHLSDGLIHNDTLRELFPAASESVNDEHVLNLCPGLSLNRGLETLNLACSNITDTGIGYLVQCMQDNAYLKQVVISQSWNFDNFINGGPGTNWDKLQYWLALNKLNRKLIKEQPGRLDRCHYLEFGR
jgi:hypothetical protein